MPAPKKKTSKAKVSVKDLKARKNPKGGHARNPNVADKHHSIDRNKFNF